MTMKGNGKTRPKGATMNIEDLKNPELQEKLKRCETVDELVQLVKAEGMELNDEQLAAVAGGDNEWYCLCDGPDGFHGCAHRF